MTIGSVDSGLAASRRPGMTFLTNSSVAHLANFEHSHAVCGIIAAFGGLLGNNEKGES
ncbi:hypothetical protein SAMN05444159_5633 [Bradyrhizobium lablabi]|uniref:Uncharacterized protein n=1 Tax=Bradyrhizobium lablabi TaxID=722472 RepID=A0A1M6ZSA0_9BRAD|nr:hypothetical protein SAMN05444159_5633 [Bradyrhizobium lablabi]